MTLERNLITAFIIAVLLIALVYLFGQYRPTYTSWQYTAPVNSLYAQPAQAYRAIAPTTTYSYSSPQTTNSYYEYSYTQPGTTTTTYTSSDGSVIQY